MYERVAANRRRSWLLLAGFVLTVVVAGWAFGAALGGGLATGWAGLAVGLGLAGVSSATAYWKSDSIALSMARAKPADPIEYAAVHNIVEALCLGLGMPKPRLYVVGDPAPNAFATGRNPEHAAVAVTTGLLGKMNRDELEGVLAHELAHVKNYDTLVMTLAVTLVGTVILLSDFMVRALWWGGGRHSGRGRGGRDGAALLAGLGIVLLLLAPFVARLLQFAVSRRREYLADADAVLLTRYPPGLIGALEKLRDDRTVVRTASRATAHLWIEEPIPLESNSWNKAGTPPVSVGRLNRLFSTHPPLEARIRALRESPVAGPLREPTATGR